MGVALAVAVASSARATTIDTVDFTLSDWTQPIDGGIPSFGTMTGSFTGAVESDPLGTIKLSDLSAFSVSYTDAHAFNPLDLA